jgi:enolase-phosphatase E1
MRVKVKADYLLFDVEGTVSPLTFVREVLFPYSLERLKDFLVLNQDDPYLRTELAMVPGAVDPAGDLRVEAAVRHLADLIRRDVKDPLLKEIQGRIWRQGFESGAFKSPLFSDVAPAWKRWRDGGKRLGIYSSGSVQAQRLFFAHTSDGDISEWIDHHFDLSVGSKRDKASYLSIVKALNRPAGRVAFFSDVREELVAAREAGLQSVQLRRPQTPLEVFEPHLVSLADLIVD